MLGAFLGLHFNGDVDATGIATVLLAIATAVLAGYTRRSVTQNALELAQSQRPVMVALASREVWPNVVDDHFVMPVINVGVGPAMDIRVDVEFGDIQGYATSAGRVTATAKRSAVGAGQQTALDFEFGGGSAPLTSIMGFAYNIEFADVSGKKWLSQGFYAADERVFRNLNVSEGALSEAFRYRVHPRDTARDPQ